MPHIPFQGGGPATTAPLAGQVQRMAATPSAIAAHVRSGRVRPLAFRGRDRQPTFGAVPTFIEGALTSVEFYVRVGRFAPAGMPAPVIASLREADADFRRALAAGGNPRDHRDGEAFQRCHEEDTVRVVRALGRIE